MNEYIMRQAGLGKSVNLIKAGKCPTCQKQIEPGEFMEEINKREYKISGMCQKCQDETFN